MKFQKRDCRTRVRAAGHSGPKPETHSEFMRSGRCGSESRLFVAGASPIGRPDAPVPGNVAVGRLRASFHSAASVAASARVTSSRGQGAPEPRHRCGRPIPETSDARDLLPPGSEFESSGAMRALLLSRNLDALYSKNSWKLRESDYILGAPRGHKWLPRFLNLSRKPFGQNGASLSVSGFASASSTARWSA